MLKAMHIKSEGQGGQTHHSIIILLLQLKAESINPSMWSSFLHFGIALLRLSLPPNDTKTIESPTDNLGLDLSGYLSRCEDEGKGNTTACFPNDIGGIQGCSWFFGSSFISVLESHMCTDSTTSYCCELRQPLSQTEVHGLVVESNSESAAAKRFAPWFGLDTLHPRLENESPQPVVSKNSRQLTMLKPRHSTPSYGANCGPNGNGLTTACYWKGAFGSTPDEACRETWGPDFRSIGTMCICNDPYHSYCCVKQ